MPTYQYECGACGHSFEIIQPMSAKRLSTCPQCKKRKLHRLIGAGAGIIFKGSGFYETDYKKKPVSSESTNSEPKNSQPKKESQPVPKGTYSAAAQKSCSGNCGCHT